jgi:myo-inositol-1-phosphate synthase
MKGDRVGLWMIGALGGIGSTVSLGLAALARNMVPNTGLVTFLPLFEGLCLNQAQDFVVGGHDIREATLEGAVDDLQKGSNIFDPVLVASCRDTLSEWQANVRPGVVIHCGSTIEKLVSHPGVIISDTAKRALLQIQSDLENFRDRNNLNQVVVLNVASTEPPYPLGEEHESLDKMSALLERRDLNAPLLPSSSLYAWAAMDLGLPYINFTPSLGSSVPALHELAVKRRTTHAGKDGKTGETLMKTVLAPMFANRNLQVLSWVGHNIFGNRDGQVLNDPENKKSKVRSKDEVIRAILGYQPQTLVSIEYIESLDDWKTAWDHIHFRGFLGVKMVMQFTWQGCDSILAAPLALDLVRLVLYAQRRGEAGVLEHLACFFKSPMVKAGRAEHDFFRQTAALEKYVRECSQGKAV